jgi:hypothetical protein
MNEQGCEWRVSTKPNKRPRVYKCLVCGAKSKRLPLPCQRALIEAIEEPGDAKRVDAVALALLRATCRYYGDPIPENPDLSLTRVLARAALDEIAATLPRTLDGDHS